MLKDKNDPDSRDPGRLRRAIRDAGAHEIDSSESLGHFAKTFSDRSIHHGTTDAAAIVELLDAIEASLTPEQRAARAEAENDEWLAERRDLLVHMKTTVRGLETDFSFQSVDYPAKISSLTESLARNGLGCRDTTLHHAQHAEQILDMRGNGTVADPLIGGPFVGDMSVAARVAYLLAKDRNAPQVFRVNDLYFEIDSERLTATLIGQQPRIGKYAPYREMDPSRERYYLKMLEAVRHGLFGHIA